MFMICLLMWLVFNGRVTFEILIFGVVISAAIYGMFCVLFDFSFEKDKILMSRFPAIILLCGILLIEIVKSNLAVIKLIYSKKVPSACYTSFRSDLKSRAAQIILADCITLTPGTITGLLENGEYTVHCLDKNFAEGLTDNTLIRQLKKLEKEY